MKQLFWAIWSEHRYPSNHKNCLNFFFFSVRIKKLKSAYFACGRDVACVFGGAPSHKQPFFKRDNDALIVSLCRTYLKIRESIDFEQNDFT